MLLFSLILLPLFSSFSANSRANPTALLLSSMMMLRHMKLDSFADRIHKAALQTIAEGTRTGDLGGKASTQQYTQAIIDKL